MDDLHLVDRGCCNGHGGTCSKLHVYDWLDDVITISNPSDLVEVRFKNTRKDFFRNVNNLKLDPGDIVAVEANPGHDIGIVTVTGDLVMDQMKKHKLVKQSEAGISETGDECEGIDMAHGGLNDREKDQVGAKGNDHGDKSCHAVAGAKLFQQFLQPACAKPKKDQCR